MRAVAEGAPASAGAGGGAGSLRGGTVRRGRPERTRPGAPSTSARAALGPARAGSGDTLHPQPGVPPGGGAIVYEDAPTPQGIHDRYRVLNGAIYGLASHGRLGGGFKPGNRRSELPGLYLAGGSAHPGPGMPMVMMSGWIAADAAAADADAALPPAAG
ncbi:hypothetical protein PSMK_03750 [Phycisphaera mikurensis NBRC 102666]|uniref:Uncharacterized protein n=1 Tax=Phycisphaera mikurensis (strain NBRC 102666 / KCTC 22515 / FYK2301M01) TaxID=1142394 RepID=I0IB96_PHYMF|nr:hypothetical protein PSMK_03750 [Phycisphaera mikurensis NBRC 102666]